MPIDVDLLHVPLYLGYTAAGDACGSPCKMQAPGGMVEGSAGAGSILRFRVARLPMSITFM